MRAPVIIIGGGGHAGMVAEALRLDGYQLLGFVDPDPRASVTGLEHLGDEGLLDTLPVDRHLLALGLGSIGDCAPRANRFEALRERGFAFVEVHHPSAQLSDELSRGQGCQFLPGAIVNRASQLGANVLINTGAIVEHDCRIGDHGHVASGATLCGGCSLGDRVHVGAGAVVLQGVSIGSGCTIAAGAVVTGDVGDGERLAGAPARPMRRRR